MPEPYFRPPKINVAELTGLSRFAQQQTDWLRRSGALRVVDTQTALRSFMPDTSRFLENYFNSTSTLKLLTGSSVVTALQDAQATKRLLTPKFESLRLGSGLAEQMRHSLGISEQLAASTRMLAEFRRPVTFELPTSLSAHAYRIVIETTPMSPTAVEADRVAFAGHDALGTSEMSLVFETEPEEEAEALDETAYYALMPDRLHGEIRSALGSLHPQLVNRLDGAWERLSATGPDAASQAAHSVQELIDWTLRLAAPDPDVLAWHKANSRSSDELHDDKPTRSLRVKYVIRNRPEQSKAARYYTRSLGDVVGILQEAKHGVEGGSVPLVGNLLLTVEGFLGFLLVE